MMINSIQSFKFLLFSSVQFKKYSNCWRRESWLKSLSYCVFQQKTYYTVMIVRITFVAAFAIL